jgi:hypothetical protein
VEALGYEYLAHGNAGPLILQKRDGARLKVYLLFHTDRSTLPYRVGFPVMVTNMANIALAQAELAELAAAPTGSLPRIHLTAGEDYRITTPSGEHFEQTADAAGYVAGIPATQIGVYNIHRGSQPAAKIGAALLNPTETSLEGVSEIHLNEVAVAAEEERIKADKPWWPTLAMLAFALLLVEWWVFQKRPAGVMS